MNSADLNRLLLRLNACSDGRIWANDRSLKMAYETNTKPEWLMWFAGSIGVDRRKLVFGSCIYARLSLRLLPENELRPSKTLRLAEAWGRGEGGVTVDDLKRSADACYSAFSAGIYAAYPAYATADVASSSNPSAAMYAIQSAGLTIDAKGRLPPSLILPLKEIVTWTSIDTAIRNFK
jgi:hypothetical protein